jgi:hypothetical protein
MTRGGLVIGLGGVGVRVVARVRQAIASSGMGRVPDNLRLSAFDVLKPAPGTGKLTPAYHFLVQIPPAGTEDEALAPRAAARQALLRDLERGTIASLTLQNLAVNLEGLRKAGCDKADVFLTCSSFGSTGTAWLLDMAYLVRHLAQSRLKVRVHALLVLPEAFERLFYPTQAMLTTNFVTLNELVAFQRERSWEKGFSLYAGKYIGSLPGLLTVRPFDTIQVIDGQEMATSPEAGAIPAAADGILCQLDAQVSAVLEEAAQLSGPSGTGAFSSFGVFTLVHPTRLLLDQSIQRLLLGTVDQLIPTEKNPDTGRPTGIAVPVNHRPDNPYGNLEIWMGNASSSGVLQDVLREAAMLADRSGGARLSWAGELADRSLENWKRALYQVEGSEKYIPQGDEMPESLQPLVACHLRRFLQCLSQRIANPQASLGAPLEYLEMLERAFSAYLQDLDRAVEDWKRRGEHSENEALKKSVADARKDWEGKRTSLFSRIAPQGVTGAQERFINARQSQLHYRQREAVAAAITQCVVALMSLTHQLAEFYRSASQALAFAQDSVYNTALDRLTRLDREIKFETAVRTQQIVVDTGYESRQAGLVFTEFGQLLNRAILHGLEGLEGSVNWEKGIASPAFNLREADPHNEAVNLASPELSVEQMALLLTRYLSQWFASELMRIQPDNNVIHFLNYLDPRADRLGSRLAQGSCAALKTVTPLFSKRTFIFAPEAAGVTGPLTFEPSFAQQMKGEVEHQLGDVFVVQTQDNDRLTLFRFFDAVGLDNLVSFHNSVPRKIDPQELKRYVLWNIA